MAESSTRECDLGALKCLQTWIINFGLNSLQTYQHFNFTAYHHLSGTGTTARLLWPSLSTVRTAKITLSFDSWIVTRVAGPASCICSQSGLAVARQRTS